MTEANSGQVATRTFTGAGADPSKDYDTWKKWSKAHLIVSKARGVPNEALGSLLFTCIGGLAFQEIEDLDPATDLSGADGPDKIYARLDKRFPAQEAQDRVGESLDGIFQLKVEKRERTEVFVGRALQVFENTT